MIPTRLGPGDLELAERCAKRRLRDALVVGANDRFGRNSVTSHYWGAAGEIAVARYLSIAWYCHTKRWAQPDVGRYEVRAVGAGTRWYAKTKDNDGCPIALVLFHTRSEGLIAGWIEPDTIRRLGKREDPGQVNAPAWFLRDLSHLNPRFPELGPKPVIVPAGRFMMARNADGSYAYTGDVDEEVDAQAGGPPEVGSAADRAAPDGATAGAPGPAHRDPGGHPGEGEGR